MKKPINIVSLFDGMSCGQIAIRELFQGPYTWNASEIHKPSINVTQYNFPKTIQLGDVRKIDKKIIKRFFNEVFILMAGSPCTDFSISGKRKGMVTKDNTEITSYKQYLKLRNSNYEFQGQSYLFWEFIRLLKEIKPKYFFLENVVMKGKSKKWEKIISKELGVEPIRINSGLITAQNRDRLYWTNIPNVTIPEDMNILVSDVIPDAVSGFGYRGQKLGDDDFYTRLGRTRKDNKANCLTKSSSTRMVTTYDGNHRSLTIEECEMLQGVPEGYTQVLGVSKGNRYDMLGNGWTIPVIQHIFSFIPEFKKKKEYSR
jgi:DNA (cytosine-5)-methyltransferase 3A